MELDIKNHLDINIKNNMPCDAYIIRDDESMKAKMKKKIKMKKLKKKFNASYV